ncbi:MAG: N-acyl-L-homoserine lactone synthase [Alphaproteobacteria bacterium]|nr:N-acyl-L-homoserine lactone synthase [Alphaproteobacteria bacterium]
MAIIMEGRRNHSDHRLLRAMFEARKRVFVDLLRWDVPVLDGRYEIDQFDDENAIYVIVTDGEGRHRGSARLLPTMRPHILDTLFPQLCADRPPRGAGIFEITRFCLDREQDATSRLIARNRLVSAMVDYAIDNGIHAFSGVAEVGWLQQILAFGWRCSPLGLPRQIGGRMLGALRIEIGENTPALLSWNKIYAPDMLQGALEAA